VAKKRSAGKRDTVRTKNATFYGDRGDPCRLSANGTQIECERAGGVWRAALNSCEYQSPGIPPR